jgi:hypothetical protein
MATESVAPEGAVGAAIAGAPPPTLRMLDDGNTAEPAADVDPETVILTCANCGAQMDERKCKLICRCGYFLSCSDYY